MKAFGRGFDSPRLHFIELVSDLALSWFYLYPQLIDQPHNQEGLLDEASLHIAYKLRYSRAQHSDSPCITLSNNCCYKCSDKRFYGHRYYTDQNLSCTASNMQRKCRDNRSPPNIRCKWRRIEGSQLFDLRCIDRVWLDGQTDIERTLDYRHDARPCKMRSTSNNASASKALL